jgi:hypothetical protein
MRVRSIEGQPFNTADGTINFTAEELVSKAIHEASFGSRGQIEALKAQVDCLAEIVGRLVEWVPEKDRLAVTGLSHRLERI